MPHRPLHRRPGRRVAHSTGLWLGLVAAFVGCSEDKESTGILDTGGASDTGTDPGLGFGPEDVDLTLSANGIAIAIRESEQLFSLGIAPDCDIEDPSCWLAESCLDEQSSYEFCHPLAANGGTLRKVGTPSEITEGANTLFDDSFEGQLGYALIPAEGGECFAWGTNKAYYVNALGCTAW